jgi:hypothetical protein
MSQSDSSSDSELDIDDVKLVHECINEYEAERKEEGRRKRHDIIARKEEVVISQEDLSKIVLTKKQLSQLRKDQKERDQKEKKERTEAQKKQLAEINERKRKQIDLRKSKEEEGIVLKINKTQLRKKPSEKAPPKIKEVVVSDDEEEPKRFQGKKPNLEEIEEKVQKLNMINQVIETQNPYLAMILKNRKK